MAQPTGDGSGSNGRVKGPDARILKVGAILGFLTIVSIWAFEVIGPSTVAGFEPSGSRDPATVRDYFAHAQLSPLAILASVAAFSFAGFIQSLRAALPNDAVSKFLGDLSWGFALVEVGAILAKNAMRAAMVSDVAIGADPMPTFFLYDYLWNSGIYLVEGALLVTISLALLHGRSLPAVVCKFGLVAGAVQLFSAAVLPLGLASTASLPGNLIFSAWFVVVSWSLWRRGRGAGTQREPPAGGTRAPPE